MATLNMATLDKIEKAISSKNAIKTSLINKGANIDDTTKLSDYPAAIDALIVGAEPFDPSTLTLFCHSQNSGEKEEYFHGAFSDIKITATSYNKFISKVKKTGFVAGLFCESDFTGYPDFTYTHDSTWVLGGGTYPSNYSVKNNDMNYYGTFCATKGLVNLDFDATGAISLKGCFQNIPNNTSDGLKKVTVRNQNLDDVQYQFAFRRRTNLEEVYFVNTSYPGYFDATFEYCSSLKKIDGLRPYPRSLNTYTLNGCTALQEITNLDILNCGKNFTFNQVVLHDSSYPKCTALTKLTFKPGTSPLRAGSVIDISGTQMSHDAIVEMFNTAPKLSTGASTFLCTGAPGTSTLTADEIAIATAKGWTVTTA